MNNMNILNIMIFNIDIIYINNNDHINIII